MPGGNEIGARWARDMRRRERMRALTAVSVVSAEASADPSRDAVPRASVLFLVLFDCDIIYAFVYLVQ